MKSKKVKKLVIKPHHSESYMKEKEGEYFDRKHVRNLIIKENCDCYGLDEKGNKKLLFKLRKNVIPKNIVYLE